MSEGHGGGGGGGSLIGHLGEVLSTKRILEAGLSEPVIDPLKGILRVVSPVFTAAEMIDGLGKGKSGAKPAKAASAPAHH